MLRLSNASWMFEISGTMRLTIPLFFYGLKVSGVIDCGRFIFSFDPGQKRRGMRNVKIKSLFIVKMGSLKMGVFLFGHK